jgi:5'-nucleotidase
MIRTPNPFSAIITITAALALSACATVPAPADQAVAPVELRVIGLNDFHGNLEPRRRPMPVTKPDGTTVSIPVGGGAHVATAVAKYRAKNEHSLVIAAGDLIGGSPLASAYFLDEPAIGVMNRIGLDFNAVGNHEFDRGWQELKRIQDGGCEQFTIRQPCAVETPYAGADFSFLAANVFMPDGGTLFPSYGIRTFGEGPQAVTVGIIGLTLKDTPNLVTPSGVDGLTFADEAETINASVGELKTQGVDAIIVSIHQGLYTEVGYNDKSCGGVSGPLIDILKQVDPRVDLVISGHTHRSYVCDFTDIDAERRFWVTSAGYGNGLLTDIAMTIDPVLGKVTRVTANNIIVQSSGVDPEVNAAPVDPDLEAFAPEPEIAAYVARYVEASRAEAERAVGRITGDGRDPGPSTEETPLGNAIADAQLFATRQVGAQIAFMNVSGVRAPLVASEDGTITYGDIFYAQPFSNTLVTRTFSGAQLLALLEQQFDDEGFVQTFAVSDGFVQSYDMSRPAGKRVVSATFDGQPIDPAGSYRVTMNNFLASGGDSFTMFEAGTDSVVGPLDLDAFELWLRQEDVRALPPEGRVTDLTPG